MEGPWVRRGRERAAERISIPDRANAPAAADGPVVEVPLAQVLLDERLASRGRPPRAAIVRAYARLMEDGHGFPPVDLGRVDGRLLLWDGRHRLEAARSLGQPAIAARVTSCTLQEAVWLAAGSNAGHGLRRSNADKRRAVEMVLADPALARRGDREIGRQCGVDGKTVARLRLAAPHGGATAAVVASVCGTSADAVREVRRGGATFPMSVGKIGRRAVPAPRVPPEGFPTGVPAGVAGAELGSAVLSLREAIRRVEQALARWADVPQAAAGELARRCRDLSRAAGAVAQFLQPAHDGTPPP